VHIGLINFLYYIIGLFDKNENTLNIILHNINFIYKISIFNIYIIVRQYYVNSDNNNNNYNQVSSGYRC